MKSFTQLFATMTKTVGASSIQLAITLVATPIMTRLYDPSAYATFGIINTAATVLVGVGLLSLPNAYCAQKEAAVRSDLIQAMLLLLFGLVLLAAMGAAALALANMLHAGITISGAALALLPLLVFTYGLRQIMVNMAIQKAQFNRLSVGQMVEPLCSRGGSIALGAGLGGHPAWILMAVALGHLSTMIILSKAIPHHLLTRVRLLAGHGHKLIGNLKLFSDFAVFSTVSQQAQPMAMLGMQIGIAAFFSSHLAGQYILAVSILTLPVSLVALSTAPVVYHHFIETEKAASEALGRHFLVAMGLYLLAGIVVLAPIFFWGEEIFRFAFGDIWAHAGKISGILSVAYVGTFAVTGVQSILMVTRRLKLQCVLEIGTCIPAILVAMICFKRLDFDVAIGYLSLIWLLRNIVLLCAALAAAFQHPHPSQR